LKQAIFARGVSIFSKGKSVRYVMSGIRGLGTGFFAGQIGGYFYVLNSDLGLGKENGP